MNSFRFLFFGFFLSGKHFICPPILNDILARQRDLSCRSLFFMTLNISCQSLLTCTVSFEKSADNLVGTALQISNCFYLDASQSLSLSLTFGILIMMCLGMVLFGSNLFGLSVLPGLVWLFSSPKQGSFLSLFFQIISCSSSSASSTPMIWMLVYLEMSQRLLTLPHFF